jgi:hypothetical protein
MIGGGKEIEKRGFFFNIKIKLIKESTFGSLDIFID